MQVTRNSLKKHYFYIKSADKVKTLYKLRITAIFINLATLQKC